MDGAMLVLFKPFADCLFPHLGELDFDAGLADCSLAKAPWEGEKLHLSASPLSR